MNKHNIIENANFKSSQTAYIYLSASAYNTYKVGRSINPEKRTKDISVGNFWKHKLLHKVQVNGLVPRLERNILKELEAVASERRDEMFLITKKNEEEVVAIFKNTITNTINEMRKQVRAKTRYETKILAEYGINKAPVYTTISRV
jgi:hypothetical protein